jgi:hypothetical protein
MLVVGLAAMFLIAAGCAQPLTRLEMDFGTSFKLAKFNQIMYPEAEKNLAPVTGLDGRAAKASIDRYRKDFEKSEAAASTTMPGSLLGMVGGGK